jgi:hypothetical protein
MNKIDIVRMIDNLLMRSNIDLQTCPTLIRFPMHEGQ